MTEPADPIRTELQQYTDLAATIARDAEIIAFGFYKPRTPEGRAAKVALLVENVERLASWTPGYQARPVLAAALTEREVLTDQAIRQHEERLQSEARRFKNELNHIRSTFELRLAAPPRAKEG